MPMFLPSRLCRLRLKILRGELLILLQSLLFFLVFVWSSFWIVRPFSQPFLVCLVSAFFSVSIAFRHTATAPRAGRSERGRLEVAASCFPQARFHIHKYSKQLSVWVVIKSVVHARKFY